MFQQYFKFIIRKLSRNRVYTVINIVGLSIAFSAAWLIYSHTSNEWNMDGYLKNGDHIYRVINRNFNEPNWNCRNNSFFGLDAQQALPEIDRIARFFLKDYQIKTDDNTDFMIESRCALVDLYLSDPSFKVISIPPIFRGLYSQRQVPNDFSIRKTRSGKQ